jgi:hypothetical protein
LEIKPPGPRPRYKGPKVILFRFGGGVRRRETILDPDQTCCPFVSRELAGRHGILFNNVVLDHSPEIVTGHGQGTLYFLTGNYENFENVPGQAAFERFQSKAPTVLESFQKHFHVPEHQALVITGEDRLNEDPFSWFNRHLYGARFRSTALSPHRFRCYCLRQELKKDDLGEKERQVKDQQLHQLEKLDAPLNERQVVSPELDRFWAQWEAYYRSNMQTYPHGDRLLTALAVRALRELRPRLLLVNYQDTDYAHGGHPELYTRAIAIIDEGIREVFQAAQGDEEYRGQTIFLVVPDCGRDHNRALAVPFQNHSNTRSAREIFIVAAGPGIAQPRAAVDRLRQQISLAPTVGRIMGFPTQQTQADPLEEMFS